MQTIANRAGELLEQKITETSARLIAASSKGYADRESQRNLDRLGMLALALGDLPPAKQEDCIAYLNRL